MAAATGRGKAQAGAAGSVGTPGGLVVHGGAGGSSHGVRSGSREERKQLSNKSITYIYEVDLAISAISLILFLFLFLFCSSETAQITSGNFDRFTGRVEV